LENYSKETSRVSAINKELKHQSAKINELLAKTVDLETQINNPDFKLVKVTHDLVKNLSSSSDE
jgi:hypothetical protein